MTALSRAIAAAEAAGIKQEKLPVDDLTINVARFGRGRPLLLLHGWPEFWIVWRPVMERLGDAFELIAPDLRGFGETGKPTLTPDPTATADRHAQDMLGLMTKLGFERFGLVAGDVGRVCGASHVASRIGEAHRYFLFLHPLSRAWFPLRTAKPFSRSLVPIFPATSLGGGTSWEFSRSLPALFQIFS